MTGKNKRNEKNGLGTTCTYVKKVRKVSILVYVRVEPGRAWYRSGIANSERHISRREEKRQRPRMAIRAEQAP